jgi:hypothetical protein
MRSLVSESLYEMTVDLDELVRQWEVAYTLKKEERLRERYAGPLAGSRVLQALAAGESRCEMEAEAVR